MDAGKIFNRDEAVEFCINSDDDSSTGGMSSDKEERLDR